MQAQAVQLVQDFLLSKGFTNTLECFKVNFIQRELSAPKNQTALDTLLNLLQYGDIDNFFRIWDIEVPEEVRASPEGTRIAFHCRVFLSIYPVHQMNKNKDEELFRQRMDQFRMYLDAKGAELSKSHDLLSFYALPYIPNAQSHPSFHEIFQKEWYTDLKGRIQSLFGHNNTQQQPQLFKLLQQVDNPQKKLEAEMRKARQRARQAEDKANQYYNTSKSVIQSLNSLYQAVMEARQGKPINQRLLQEVKSKLLQFENLITKADQAEDYNYAQIIQDLKQLQDSNQLCALLQALRWEITRQKPSLKRKFLQKFISLNILCTQPPHDQLLDRLLSSQQNIQEYTLRLLSAIASEPIGRQYLLQKQGLVRNLTNLMVEQTDDSEVRKHCLGTLQKLSLRRNAQLTMIQCGVLSWLVNILRQSKQISPYSLEYGAALLMNLSLQSQGKIQLEQINPLQLLVSFMEYPNLQIRTYIHGTLYSLLTRNFFKNYAKQINLEVKVNQCMRNADESIQRQLDFIKRQLYAPEQNSSDSESEEEDLPEETEDVEPEDDDTDDLIEVPGILTGKDLLKQRYGKSDLNVINLEEEQTVPRYSRPNYNQSNNGMLSERYRRTYNK